jgi:transcription elongation GreA/GreB family factor
MEYSYIIHTALLDRRLKELEEIISNVEIITPIEQSDTVQIENGVELQYGDGNIFRFIVVGYAFATANEGDLEEVSVYSPIGKAVLGARSGEKRNLIVGNRHIEVKVTKIYPPSKAREVKA